MSLYLVALFVHIVGAIGFFVALGVEWICLRQLGRAVTAAQAGEWLRAAVGVRRLGMASMVTLLVAGFYMMAAGNIGGAWIIVAFWALVGLSILAVTLSFRRMAALARALSDEVGSLSPALHRLLGDPLLWLGIRLRVAIALGIVFLMTIKPGLTGSLLTIGVSAALGLAAALPSMGRRSAQDEAVA